MQNKNEMQQQTLSVLVENTAGVLSQVTRLFTRKGYNIESLAVGVTNDPNISRITIILKGNDRMTTLLESQLSKLLPVISVQRLTDTDAIYREFFLIKVKAETRDARDEIIQIANIFRASIVDMSKNTLMLQISGDASKADAIMKLLSEFGIMEMARTGMIALERGDNTIYDLSKSGAEYESVKTLG